MGVKLSGNNPKDKLIIGYGFELGSTPILPACPGLFADLKDPRIFAFGLADSKGDYKTFGSVPAQACGNVYLQGINLTTCEKSNVVRVE
jgi:hypothetical protein